MYTFTQTTLMALHFIFQGCEDVPVCPRKRGRLALPGPYGMQFLIYNAALSSIFISW